MDELDVIAYEHMFGGLIAGFIAYAFTVGIFSIRNEILGILLSLIVLYGLKGLADRMDSDKVTTTSWLSNGVVQFYFVWMVTWILLLNYA